jgi:hypothetical protein
MSLSARFSGSFDSRIQVRGRSYYSGNRVRIKSGDARSVRAKVRGSENYDVKILVAPNGLIATCTCPYYYEDLCKHIYATLLEADNSGMLSDAETVPARVHMEDDPDYDLDDDYDDGVGEVHELNPDRLPRVVRSLVAEGWNVAARFTPRLRVLNHTGAGRSKEARRRKGIIID